MTSSRFSLVGMLLLALVSTLTASPFAAAQQGAAPKPPTQAETEAWIVEFIAAHGCGTGRADGFTTTRCDTPSSFHNCYLVITAAVSSTGLGAVSSKSKVFTIDFRSVVAAYSEPNYEGFGKTVDFRVKPGGRSMGLSVDSDESAARLINALNAEIRLCASNASPF
jgi:hypothetical protein